MMDIWVYMPIFHPQTRSPPFTLKKNYIGVHPAHLSRKTRLIQNIIFQTRV